MKLGHKGQTGDQEGGENWGQMKGGRAADQAGERETNSRNVSEGLPGEGRGNPRQRTDGRGLALRWEV